MDERGTFAVTPAGNYATVSIDHVGQGLPVLFSYIAPHIIDLDIGQVLVKPAARSPFAHQAVCVVHLFGGRRPKMPAGGPVVSHHQGHGHVDVRSDNVFEHVMRIDKFSRDPDLSTSLVRHRITVLEIALTANR